MAKLLAKNEGMMLSANRQILKVTRPVRYAVDSLSYKVFGNSTAINDLKDRHKGKPMLVVGNGPSLNQTPLDEFLHCDDLADALVFLLQFYSGQAHINVGSGVEVSIRQLAEIIAQVVGYQTELIFDATKPDGTPRKLMDSSALHAMGWNNVRPLAQGVTQTYADWINHNGVRS